MEPLLVWLEGSALGQLVRASGVWAYGIVNLVHIFGIATLFGSVLALDLRLVGLWRRVPLAAVATPTVPLAAFGFCIAALSGLCLLSVNATEYGGNPFLLLKFAAIALGLTNVAALHFVPAWRARAAREPAAGERTQLAVAGAISLGAWLTAVGAGRMIGYW